MITPPQIGVHRGCRYVGDQSGGRPCPMHPAKEPRVRVADPVRQKGLHLQLHSIHLRALTRQGGLQ